MTVNRLLRSVVPAVGMALVVARIVVAAAGTPGNPDTYFHLRFGHEFLTDWSPWSPGSVSDLNTRDWVPTQWLSEIGMAAVENLGGLPALAFLYGALLVALIGLWYVAARREASPLVAVLVTVIALIAASPSLSLRPQVLSFALATVTVLAWDRAGRDARLPWLLIPLCWLWAMLHGMWILGVLLSLACAVGLLVERRLPPRVLLVPGGMLAAAALTPVGPRLVGAVLVVNGRSDYFSEWAAPEFVTAYGVAILVLLAVVILPPLLGGPAAPYDVALTVAAVALTVYSQRTVPVAAAVLVPLAARRLQALVSERARPTRTERVTGILLATVALGSLAALAPLRADDPLPAATAFEDQLAALPAGTRVLTDSTTGAVVMWAHPDLDVPVHGYGDLYTDTELRAFADLFRLAPGWEDLLRADRVGIAVLPSSLPLAAALEEHGWSVSDRAGQLVLLESANHR